MTGLGNLIRRNTKLFFRDRGMFFASLITPLILLVLFVTFLGNVYRDSLASAVPAGITVPDRLVEGFIGGWLFSSLLAVCCVTVAFCSNMLMVQDKVTGARGDLTIAPVSRTTLALGYYVSTLLSTLLTCAVALGVCLVYLWRVGWYLSGTDVALICLDVLLLTMFGTALSSVINHFLSTEGQMSAVGTVVSAGYGFLCGAYMPISQFSEGIRNFLSFLPGTYGTALVHNHLLRGVFAEMGEYLPPEVVAGIRQSFDSDVLFFEHVVTMPQMYAILGISTALLVGIFICLTCLERKKH